MSYLLYSLEQFGFNSLEEVTASRLKRAFKRTVAMAHPDKGGGEGAFDAMLGSYLYLCETLHRMNGGRTVLHSVNAPDELKEQRANQYLNELFDDLVLEPRHDDKPLPDDFHEQFAAAHVNEHANGYEAWLKTDTDENLTHGPHYGAITIDRFAEEEKFHSTFEERVLLGKPKPTALILHPDEMAYSAGVGTALIKAGVYTSQPGLRPEYTDLHAAFTTENTVYDKLLPIKTRTYEELMKEREEVYTAIADEDVATIAAYERAKIDKEIEHKRALESYFKNGAFLGDEEKSEVKL
jgi:hypothetical protein